MRNNPVQFDHQRLVELCRRHHIRRLSLFGSVLTDRFRPDSDVDVLVEFEETATVGYFTIGRLINELSDLLGRRVDVRTPAELGDGIREQVRSTAQVQYAA